MNRAEMELLLEGKSREYVRGFKDALRYNERYVEPQSFNSYLDVDDNVGD